MKCYHCGSEYVKDPNTGRMICPRCDYWKPGYKPAWKQHKDKVLELKGELGQRFPGITVVTRHGADSDEWIEIFPDEKHELDMVLWFRYRKVGHVEVTGPSWFSLPAHESIWILPGKQKVAKSNEARGEKSWFYVTYKNKTFTLRTEDIAPFDNRIYQHEIRGNLEKYHHVPQDYAFPREQLFEWIKEELNKLEV